MSALVLHDPGMQRAIKHHFNCKPGLYIISPCNSAVYLLRTFLKSLLSKGFVTHKQGKINDKCEHCFRVIMTPFSSFQENKLSEKD